MNRQQELEEKSFQQILESESEFELSEVLSIEEAMAFFLCNSSGSCMCEKENGDRLEVSCYPKAVEFFDNPRRKVENDE